MSWFQKHPVAIIFVSIICIAIVIIGIYCSPQIINNVLFNGNKQIIDTKQGFYWAIIELGNGELLEGEVRSWNDYDESDCVQIIMADGNTFLTHYSKVILCTKCP